MRAGAGKAVVRTSIGLWRHNGVRVLRATLRDGNEPTLRRCSQKFENQDTRPDEREFHRPQMQGWLWFPQRFRLFGHPAAANAHLIRPALAVHLVDLLRPWLETKPAGQPAFDVPRTTLRRDLHAAGMPFSDESGRVADFHALTQTCISRVVRSGVSVKITQELARHSRAALTIGRYAHVNIHDITKALAALPQMTGPDDTIHRSRWLAATGTGKFQQNPGSKAALVKRGQKNQKPQ